jgi:hypothetical protein
MDLYHTHVALADTPVLPLTYTERAIPCVEMRSHPISLFINGFHFREAFFTYVLTNFTA